MLRTLQKSDRNLLQWSIPDDDKSDGQVAMLGAPLSTSEHLHPDLQSLYIMKMMEMFCDYYARYWNYCLSLLDQ